MSLQAPFFQCPNLHIFYYFPHYSHISIIIPIFPIFLFPYFHHFSLLFPHFCTIFSWSKCLADFRSGRREPQRTPDIAAEAAAAAGAAGGALALERGVKSGGCSKQMGFNLDMMGVNRLF